MATNGLLLMLGGAGMALAALGILRQGKSAAAQNSYSRSAFLLAPIQLMLGLSAIVAGLVFLV